MFLAFELYQRMKFSRRATTTSRPAITRFVWIEAKSQFFHGISDKVLHYNIPYKFIINADQTSSKCVATDGSKWGKTHFPDWFQ